jgi:hypothetical protein
LSTSISHQTGGLLLSRTARTYCPSTGGGGDHLAHAREGRKPPGFVTPATVTLSHRSIYPYNSPIAGDASLWTDRLRRPALRAFRPQLPRAQQPKAIIFGKKERGDESTQNARAGRTVNDLLENIFGHIREHIKARGEMVVHLDHGHR